MFTLFFTDTSVVDFATAKTSDTSRFSTFFNHMLESGVYLPPSQFEAWFVSTAHGSDVIDEVITAAREAAQEAG